MNEHWVDWLISLDYAQDQGGPDAALLVGGEPEYVRLRDLHWRHRVWGGAGTMDPQFRCMRSKSLEAFTSVGSSEHGRGIDCVLWLRSANRSCVRRSCVRAGRRVYHV